MIRLDSSPTVRIAQSQVIFIRHAQSVSNAGWLTMPHKDIPLTEKGHQQAAALAASLDVAPAVVLVSEMVRTHQTAAPYCARFGVTPLQHAGLNEFSIIDSDLIAGMDGPQRRLFVRDYWDDPDPHRRWGETADTFFEFESRVRDFIRNLDSLADSTVIFGHGIWLGMLHWLLLGYKTRDADDMRAFQRFRHALPMPNCAAFGAERTGSTGWKMQSVDLTIPSGRKRTD